MSNLKLQADELDLLESLEGGEYDPVLTNERRKELEAAASHTFKKDKRINIRISNRDLTAIQSKAFEAPIKPDASHHPIDLKAVYRDQFSEKKSSGEGVYSVKVNGNWRITFQIEDDGATFLDYADYHGK